MRVRGDLAGVQLVLYLLRLRVSSVGGFFLMLLFMVLSPFLPQNVVPLQARRASLSSAGSCGRRGSPRSTPR